MAPADPDLVSLVTGKRGAAGWWTAAELRLKSVTALPVEVYLVSGEATGEANMAILQQVEALLHILKLLAIVAGDSQNTPEQLEETGWPGRSSLIVVRPDDIASSCTNGERLIDFFAVSECLTPLARRVRGELEVPWAPHCCVVLELVSRPRSVLSRMLRVPSPIPLQPVCKGELLVLGVRAWDAACSEAVAAVKLVDGISGRALLDYRLAKASCAAEHYLLATAGVSPDDRRPYLGRGRTPTFNLRPVVPRNRAFSRYARPKCDFWGVAQGLLLRLMAHRDRHTCDALVCRKLA